MDKEFCFFLIHFYTSKRCGCRFKYLFLSRYFWQRAVFVCCVFSVLCSLNRQRLKLFYVFIFGEHNLMLLYTIIFQWDRGVKKNLFSMHSNWRAHTTFTPFKSGIVWCLVSETLNANSSFFYFAATLFILPNGGHWFSGNAKCIHDNFSLTLYFIRNNYIVNFRNPLVYLKIINE